MLIRYIEPDPRKGRIVRLANELAEKAVAAGRAEEITEEQAAQAEVESRNPAPAEEAAPPTRKRRGPGRRK